MRSGAMSVAVIDPELSIARITVASSRGTATAISGRASPTTSALSARSVSTGGTCRRHRGRRATMFASRSTLVNRAT